MSYCITFTHANGVKQGGGGCLPYFFSIHMDKLISKLSNSNIGCKIQTNTLEFSGI